MISPAPPPAPAAAIEFGPTVEEELGAQLKREKERKKLDKPQIAKASTTSAGTRWKDVVGILGEGNWADRTIPSE